MEIAEELLEATRERDETTGYIDELDEERQILLQTLHRIHEIAEIKLKLWKVAIRQEGVVVSLKDSQERIKNKEKPNGRESKRPNH